MSNKKFMVFVHMINKDLCHFSPYSILTSDSWIIGLKCVKEIRENVLLLHFITYNLFTEPDLIQDKWYWKESMDDS